MRVRKFGDLLGQEIRAVVTRTLIDLSQHHHMETTSGEVQQRTEETNWFTCWGEALREPRGTWKRQATPKYNGWLVWDREELL